MHHPYSSKAWRQFRLLILQRDGWRCVKCRVSVAGKGRARVDHITPLSQGGALLDPANCRLPGRRGDAGMTPDARSGWATAPRLARALGEAEIVRFFDTAEAALRFLGEMASPPAESPTARWHRVAATAQRRPDDWQVSATTASAGGQVRSTGRGRHPSNHRSVERSKMPGLLDIAPPEIACELQSGDAEQAGRKPVRKSPFTDGRESRRTRTRDLGMIGAGGDPTSGGQRKR